MKSILAYPPTDFSVPFQEIPPGSIDIYFHYTSKIGQGSCEAACAHCYFRSQPDFEIPVDLAVEITEDLRNLGYSIGMTPADSFSDAALEAGEVAGSAFRIKSLGAMAWTSGMPLTRPDYYRRLERAADLGFTSVAVTGHNVVGQGLPIRGVTAENNITAAIANIRAFNRRFPERAFKVGVTFTIGNANLQLEKLRLMADWGVDHELDFVRFNCFANFGKLPEHDDLELSREQVSEFFGFLNQTQIEFLDSPLQFGISEDWGDAGIEQISAWLPADWTGRGSGWCRAGYRLFAMVSIDDEICLVGCVDRWEPILGRVSRTDSGTWGIVWDVPAVEQLRILVNAGDVYACWGGVGYDRDSSVGFTTSKATENTIMGSASRNLGITPVKRTTAFREPK